MHYGLVWAEKLHYCKTEKEFKTTENMHFSLITYSGCTKVSNSSCIMIWEVNISLVQLLNLTLY